MIARSGRWWLPLAVGFGLALGVVVRAHAGDEDDRRRLLEEIDDLLDDAADDLDGLASDSSASDVDHALDRVSRVRDKARELERVAGDDSKARDVASRYPGYADRFRDAAAGLRELKEAQRSLDEQPKQCQERSRELADKIRQYVDRNDPAGVTDIPRLANELGRPIAEALDKATRRRDELGRLRDRVRSFSESDGRWSDVRGELHSSADEILDHWVRRHDESRQACEELARLDRSRAVEEALKKLSDSEAGRQAIYREIADEIADAVRLLTDVEADGNDADVKLAERDVEDLRRLLERLRSAAGEDRKAKEMIDKWPREIDSLDRALLVLDDLKDHQFGADRAPERCKTEDEQIVRAAAELERLDPVASDPDALDRAVRELDAKTRSAREGLLDAFRRMAEGKAAAERLAVQAKAWSPGVTELRPVDEELDESADDVAKHLVKASETATQVCAAPLLGPQHPAAKKAMNDTTGDCTYDVWRPLRDEVTKHCRNTPHKCEDDHSCDELRRRVGLFDACIKARTDLTDRCFKNSPHAGHQNEIVNENRGRDRCLKFIADKRC